MVTILAVSTNYDFPIKWKRAWLSSLTSVTSVTVDVEVMNALLFPLVLGFLLALEHTALPKEFRMRGLYRILASGLTLVVIAFGLYMGYDVVRQALSTTAH